MASPPSTAEIMVMVVVMVMLLLLLIPYGKYLQHSAPASAA